MKIKDNLMNIIEMFKKMSPEEIQIYKYLLMVLLIFDLVGVYWYFNLKSLGVALMLVIMAFLAVFLFLERELEGGDIKMDEKERENLENQLKEIDKKKKEIEAKLGQEEYLDLGKDKEEDTGLGLDMGLPNAEEFQKRASKALGADDF